ncbi:MAG: response regulator [Anaerolineae bacterium]|nr:response regulator [Anaerolineae bacterium]
MPKTHILVVEDDDDARTMYAIMLRSWGYEVSEATTGREGIRQAQRQIPDLILLDVMMPDLDGFEVCKQLRSDVGYHKVPIIFLTALSASDDRIKGYVQGGDDFITKGHLEYRELGVRIQAALSRAQRHSVSAQGSSRARVIGLLSLRGGVGVTSVAMNLARYATGVSDQPVILLDLAFPVGSLALWSGLSGPRNIVTLLSRVPSEIDMALISSYSQQNVYGSYFIPGPTDVTDLSGIRLQALDQVLSVLRQEGYTVVLDLGRGTLPLMWRTLAACNWTGIITSADPTSRSLAQVAMQSLPGLGADARNLLLIYNDITNYKPADISLGFPRTPDVFIPHTEHFGDLVDPSPFAHLWSLIADRAPITL